MTSSLLDVDGTHEHKGRLFGLLPLRPAPGASVITQTQAQRDLLPTARDGTARY